MLPLLPEAVSLSVFDMETPYLLLLTLLTLLSPPELPGLDTETVPSPGLTADMVLFVTLFAETVPDTLDEEEAEDVTLLTELPVTDDDAVPFLPGTVLRPAVETVPDEMLLPPLLP